MVTELAARMAQLGQDVTVYNRRGHNVAGRGFDNCQDGTILNENNLHIVSVPTLNLKGLAALSSSFFATLKAIKARPDVIHFHAEGPSAMVPLAKLAGVPTVVTIHGLDWQRAKWNALASSYIKFGEKMTARYADEIIVLNKDTKRYFIERYGRSTHLIPNGIRKGVSKKANSIVNSFGLEKNSYILYLGRIVPEKGIHYLLEAFRNIKTSLKLVIAGGSSDSGDYFQKIKELAQKDNRVIITDFVYGEVLEELYSNAYVYVLPSDVEGMPMSLLEAMSYGNCCLVSDIPGCTDAVGDHAVLFKHGSVEDLEQKLETLIDSPEMVSRYQGGAGDYIASKYDWQKIVDGTLSVYRKAVGR